jgi:hypothetical protein
MIELNELKALWMELLGNAPSEKQWAFWGLTHTPPVIRRGILKTAQKNLSVGDRPGNASPFADLMAPTIVSRVCIIPDPLGILATLG